MKFLSLIFLLMVNAGMDRRVMFDFALSPEHRGAIALYGSTISDAPPESIDCVWKQLAGPKGFITQPNVLRPFLMVDAPGEYRLMLICGTNRSELSNGVVKFMVSGKEK